MAAFLLDTHTLIWMAKNDPALTKNALTILDSDHTLYLSIASVWEMSIKIKNEKLKLDYQLEKFIEIAIQKHSLNLLNISLSHIYHLQQLPLHHRDPFDRLLIAQSIVDNLPIISAETAFDDYQIKRVW